MAAAPRRRRRSWSISSAVGLAQLHESALQGRSAERERKSLNVRIEKLDLKLPIGDRFRLADQLIKALPGGAAVALLVNIASVSRARRLPIDQHAKSHGCSGNCRSHDQVQIAGMKAVGDAPI